MCPAIAVVGDWGSAHDGYMATPILVGKILRKAVRVKCMRCGADRYLSILTGKYAVGVARSTGGRIIGELSLDRVLDMLSQSVDDSDSVILGSRPARQWLSSSRHDAPGMYFNYAVLPSFLAIVSWQALLARRFSLAVLPVDWRRAVQPAELGDRSAAPAGWDIVEYRMTVGPVLAGFVGALLAQKPVRTAGANYVVELVQPLINR